MIKKIQKVIKGINEFSSEDIAFILEADASEIQDLLDILEQEGKIKKVSKTAYAKIQKISAKENTAKKERKSKTVKNTVKNTEKRPLIKLKPREFKITRITELEGYEEYFFANPKTKQKIQKYIRLMKETQGMKISEISEYVKNRKDKVSIRAFLSARKKIMTSGLKELIPKGGKNIPPELFAYFKKAYLSPRSLTAKEARAEAIKLFVKKYPKCRLRQIPNEQALFKKLKREYSTQEIHKYRIPDFSNFDMDELENA